MRNQRSIILIAFCIITIFSCKKSDDKDTTPAAKTTGVVPSGHFYANQLDLIYVDTLGMPDTFYMLNGDNIEAFIYSNPSNTAAALLDAGGITLNGFELERGANYNTEDTNAYGESYKIDDYNIINGAIWDIKGKGIVPAMYYNDTRHLPNYTGTFPKQIDKSKGLTITFDATTITNADSVTIAFGLDSNFQYIFSKTFPANIGTVTLTPVDLSVLYPDRYALEITPFTYTIQYFGGNPYAFVRKNMIIRHALVK